MYKYKNYKHLLVFFSRRFDFLVILFKIFFNLWTNVLFLLKRNLFDMRNFRFEMH